MTDDLINASTQILNGTILDANISTSAAIATEKLAQGALFLLANGTVVWTGDLNAGSYQLNYLANGTASSDAVNLGQVNSLIAAAVAAGVTPLTWEGSWSSSANYAINQVVSFNNAVYLSILGSNIANEPDTAPTYWALMCAGTTGSAPNFSDEEIPSGAINGSNASFTLAHAPVMGSLKLYWNGVRSTSSDYSVSGSTITTTYPPATGDNLIVDYRY